MTEHPITPPPELVQQWHVEAMKGFRTNGVYEQDIATQSARWGADQELEACGAYLERCAQWEPEDIDELRAVRRPKPPSLNEVALQMLGTIERDAHYLPEITDTIRRALEALPE